MKNRLIVIMIAFATLAVAGCESKQAKVKLIFYSLSEVSACKSLILLKTVVNFCKM